MFLGIRLHNNLSIYALLSLNKYGDSSHHVSWSSVNPLLCLATSLSSLSSAMAKWIPFPQGREVRVWLPLPIHKMLESQVAKLLPLASFT